MGSEPPPLFDRGRRGLRRLRAGETGLFPSRSSPPNFILRATHERVRGDLRIQDYVSLNPSLRIDCLSPPGLDESRPSRTKTATPRMLPCPHASPPGDVCVRVKPTANSDRRIAYEYTRVHALPSPLARSVRPAHISSEPTHSARTHDRSPRSGRPPPTLRPVRF